MDTQQLSRNIDTVIVGCGPSALILSYILHGHIPYYNPANPHPDTLLHQKLSRSPCLLNVNVKDLTSHFAASRMSYSTQALPINVLLDTLLRPMADTDLDTFKPCVEWRFEEDRRVDHIIAGDTRHAGGQWANNPIEASWNVAALSYVEMISLPGYSFEQYLQDFTKLEDVAPLHRPSRRDVADYLARYPELVRISDCLYLDVALDGITRHESGFHINSHNIKCRNLVLATGTYSQLLQPRPLLQPLRNLQHSEPAGSTLLVIGSGFTAADVILSAPTSSKIIHIYKWDPDNDPSPLKACHRSAYPEYASIYRRMKKAATTNPSNAIESTSNPQSFEYEGFPNTLVTDVSLSADGSYATLTFLRGDNACSFTRIISNFAYVTGRRGSLTYLSESLRAEILSPAQRHADPATISGRLLRDQAAQDVELAPNLFVVGSLVGDSLIRFAHGCCVLVAGRLFGDRKRRVDSEQNNFGTASATSSASSTPAGTERGASCCGEMDTPLTPLSVHECGDEDLNMVIKGSTL